MNKVTNLTNISLYSCCLDFIAAGHIEADAIIHFGAVCFSQNTKKLPFLNIYEKHDIKVEHLIGAVELFLNSKPMTEVYLLVDTPFIHKIGKFIEYDFSSSSLISYRCYSTIYDKNG